MRDWLGMFLETKAAEAGAAKNTLEAYARDLNSFLGWCGHNGHAP